MGAVLLTAAAATDSAAATSNALVSGQGRRPGPVQQGRGGAPPTPSAAAA